MNRVIIALRTFFALALPYFRSDDRWPGRALLVGVIGAELGLVYVAVAANQWTARFFNALEARSWEATKAELVIFLFITIGAILSGMAQYYFGQALLIRWRRWMTDRYVGMWMAEGRHYRLRFVDQSVDNIHLRIANDVYLFIQRTHELGTGLLGSVVAIASFAYILWGISAIAPLPLFGIDFSFPGYLIWLALVYAGIGTFIAHMVGQPLIPLNFKQQRYESDFRFAIARVTDHAEAVALMGGEAVEREELKRRFGALVRNWTALINRQTKLNGFIFGYAHVSTVVPILVVSPAFPCRRHSARYAGPVLQRLSAGRGRFRVLSQFLQQDCGMERGHGPSGAIRACHGRCRSTGAPWRRARHCACCGGGTCDP
jgi:putative ATP-binding cassette transporter